MSHGNAYLRQHHATKIELENDWPYSMLIEPAFMEAHGFEWNLELDVIVIDLANACAIYKVIGETPYGQLVCELQFGEKDHEATPFRAPLPHRAYLFPE